jgi:hypothetical protein
MSITNLFNVVDGAGFCGGILIYCSIIALVGSALLLFIYFWRTGKLDMDESPKWLMMDDASDRSED